MLAKHFYGLGEASLYVVKTRPFCKKGLVTVTYNTYNILHHIINYTYLYYLYVLYTMTIHEMARFGIQGAIQYIHSSRAR